MKKSFILFAALAALFSCTKETPVSPETPSQETYSVTLTAVAPTAGDDTKTTLVEGGKFVHWSKGDAIKVLFFPDCTSNDKYLGPNGVFQSYFTEENSKEAFFRIENWSWQSSGIETSPGTGKLMDVGIAVYPHTATAVSNKVGGFGSQNAIQSEVSFELPAVQNAVKNNIENGLNFSYALISASGLAETINSGGETNLSFKNACAMIELTMPQSFNGKKVTSISVISNDGVALTGKGNVNLGNKNYSSTQNIIPSPFEVIVSGDSGVELSNPEGFEPGQKYYAVVWPGSHPSGLTIQFTAEDGSVASKTTQSVDFAASRVRPYVFKNALEFKAGIPEGATVASVVFKDCDFVNTYVVDNEKIYLDDAQTVYAKFTQGSAGTAPAYYSSGEAIRMYHNGSKLEVSAPGKTIVSIEFTFASNHWYLGTSQGEFSAEDATRTWTGEAETVNFVSTGTDKNHRAYVSAMKVIYL